MRRVVTIVLFAAGTALLFRVVARPDPLPKLPSLMLWAWESPQDLRFISRHAVGIAFLERTVLLNNHVIEVRPRLQPLLFNPGTDLMAVVRIESSGNGLPPVDAVIPAIRPAFRVPGMRALQIDFDARLSERDWYAKFLQELRASLPPVLPLVVTALESWCEETNGWLANLPVEDATAMLFRMGSGEQRSPPGFPGRACQSSIGVATDELPVRIPPANRIYFFHPGPWNKEAYEQVVAQARRWRR